MTGAPPLRFLALVLGGWVAVRAAMLAPWGGPEPVPVVREEARESKPAASAPLAEAAEAPAPIPGHAAAPVRAGHRLPIVSLAAVGKSNWVAPALPQAAAPTPPPPPSPAPPPPLAAAFPPLVPPAPPPLAIPARAPGRWSASAWAFVRDGGSGQGLGAPASLGGSQAGGRILYRLNGDPARPLSLSARAYLPVERSAGAEAALGIEWQPVASIPLRLLAERRQALGSEGRSAFALLAHGGVHELRAGPAFIDGYAQAGIVGARSRDAFVDGGAQVSLKPLPARDLKVGIGLWGAAQPRISRLDAGPQASLGLGVGEASFRLSAGWRFRIAGDAAPASGPALGIGADF